MTTPPPAKKVIPEGFFSYEKHLFICGGEKCCSKEKGEDLWEYTKIKIRSSGLDRKIHRTFVKCLRYCQDGPIGVLYPEGQWLKNLDRKAIDHFLEEGRFPDECHLAKKN